MQSAATFMRQSDRHLLQCINLSRHADTDYFNPVPMTNIQARVRGNFRSARALRSGQKIEVIQNAGYAEFTLPALPEYKLLDLG